MEKFIRLDMVDHWRGREHCSSVMGLGDEYEHLWEKGISCYSLNNIGEAIENLRDYWTKIACMTKSEEYKNMQVTIFEGEKLHNEIGADWEDLATCENTIAEFPAQPFISKVFELYDLYEYEEELTETEYYNELEKLLSQYVILY